MKSRRPKLLLAVAVLVIAPLFGPPLSMQQAPKRPVEVEDVVAWKTLGTHGAVEQRPVVRLSPRAAGGGRRGRRQARCTADKTMRFPSAKLPAGGAGGWPGRRGRRRRLGARVFRRWEVGRVHVLSDARGGAAAEAAAPADPVERDGGEPRDRREEGISRRSGALRSRVNRRRWIALQRYGADAPRAAARRRRGRRAWTRRGGGWREAARPRAAARHRSDPARAGQRRRAQRRQRQRVLLPQGRQAARARDRRAGQGGQRPAASRHGDRRGVAARQRQRDATSGSPGATRATRSRCSRAPTTAPIATSSTPSSASPISTAAAPKKVVFDPAADASVPKGMSISPNRAPLWTDDLRGDALRSLRAAPQGRRRRDRRRRADATRAGAAPRASRRGAPNTDEKVDLVLWHYKDPRLQTQQEVQEARDRAYNYVAEYRVAGEEVHPAGRRRDAERDGQSRSRAAGASAATTASTS